MPQLDMTYSAGLALDARAILARAEQVIRAGDESAGEVKGRAEAITQDHRANVFLHVRMLPKPHRTAEWQSALAGTLRAELAGMIGGACVLSVLVEDSLRAYASGAING